MRDRDKNLLTISISLFLIASVVAPIFLPQVESKTIILQTPSGTDSCVTDFVLAQNLTDLCDVTIIDPLTSQIIEYNGTQWINVNSTTFSDTTVCNNLGTGVIICAGGNVNLKSLVAGSGITLTPTATEIMINSTGGTDDTVCANVGLGSQVYKDGECNFRTLTEGANIDLTQNADDISIAVTGITSDNTVCANVGGGFEVFRDGECNFRTLLEGTSIDITQGADTLTLTNTAPDNTACFNVGTGLGVYSGGECQFDSLIAGTGITITDTTDDLTFASQCANTGTGEAVCESSNNINSLIAGDAITITDTTGDLTISSPRVAQFTTQVFQSETRTNVGTTYVDAYQSAFANEDYSATIFCGNATQFYVQASYDYVGTGTHSLRVVERNDNNNVLSERTDITTDVNGAPINFNFPNHVNWIDNPSWCTTERMNVELQVASTVGTDDPVVKGYVIFSR